MIQDSSINADQYEEVLEMFSNYLNDINLVINSVKKSIYEILNIQLHLSDNLALPNIASVSAYGKKTMDDLKRISSVLRGYSRSKNAQREQQQTRRSRIQNSSLSRNAQSRISRYSNTNSSAGFSKYQKAERSLSKRQQIDMVTFELPQPQNSKHQHNDADFVTKLNHHRSLRTLSKTTELPNAQQLNEHQSSDKSQNSNNQQNMPFFSQHSNTPTNRKRAKTSDKYTPKHISSVLVETQIKFKQCLVKHESGMDEIIRRNGECLQILRDLQNNIKNKKSKKRTETSPAQQSQKPSFKYQSMTMSTRIQP